jgi:hypothetical protein
MSYLGVSGGGPEEAYDYAMQMRVAGEQFAVDAPPLIEAIRAVEAGKPWGDDHFGKTFMENYAQHGHGSEPLNHAVTESMKDSGHAMAKLGTSVMEAFHRFVIVEDDNARALTLEANKPADGSA